MNPRQLSIKDYTYDLPDERIARFPLADRDNSKLLIYKKGIMEEDRYSNLQNHLPEESILVFNNTRVIEARILFQKPTGGVIEIFALEPERQDSGIAAAMQAKGTVHWRCLIGGAGKWKHGRVMQKNVEREEKKIKLEARIIERSATYFTVEFSWTPDNLTFAEVLHTAGVLPIPPYLKRETEKSDEERYQTIFASTDGSVAAPTAGLHFTPALIQALHSKQIQTGFVTLHVGAGTFMPVKSESLSGHQMHAEYMEVEQSFIRRLVGGPDVFAVGTTSLRTLESLYWMGLKCILHPRISFKDLEISQWEVYEGLEEKAVPVPAALLALAEWMKSAGLEKLVIKTQILIAPGYRPKLIAGLITNFHQPGSTLLLLVAAMIGNDWHKVYDYALTHDFRFLSYGDGCLLYLQQQTAVAFQ